MARFNGPDTLERWPVEQWNIHRGLLLWAMQHPSEDTAVARSIRAVARAMRKPEPTVRNWHRSHRWAARADATPDAENRAVALYREHYFRDHGGSDLPHVAPRVIVSLTLTAHKAAPTGDGADEVISRARMSADAAVRVETAVMETVQAARKAERVKVTQFRGLVDAVLGKTAQLLRDDKLKLTAKDIPAMLQARSLLTDWLMHNDDRHVDQRAAVESARVKHAREHGTDLLDAVWQDLQELVVILGALRTRRTDPVNDAQAQYEKARVAATPAPVDGPGPVFLPDDD